jgi:hypothetical protein
MESIQQRLPMTPKHFSTTRIKKVIKFNSMELEYSHEFLVLILPLSLESAPS